MSQFLCLFFFDFDLFTDSLFPSIVFVIVFGVTKLARHRSTYDDGCHSDIQKVTARNVFCEHIFGGVCPSIFNVLRSLKVTAYFVFCIHIFGGVCPGIKTPPTLCSVYTCSAASVRPSTTCYDYLLLFVFLTHGRRRPSAPGDVRYSTDHPQSHRLICVL